MKLKIINLLSALIMCLFNNSFSLEAPVEKQEEKIHGLILKAKISNEENLYFVPSHHHSPLSKFTQRFQGEIFKHSHLILESFLKTEHPLSPLSLLMQYASKDFIESIGGFVQNPQQEWSLDPYPDVKFKYESAFEKIANIANTMSYDLPHFRNIYTMKPGVVVALFSEIDAALNILSTTISNTSEECIISFSIGMDGHIAEIFTTNKKPITGVEVKLDVINSLSLSTKTFNDIIDDVTDDHYDGVYFSSLEEIHFSLLKEVGKKRLMDVHSLAIRNKSWIKKYEGILTDYKDSIAIHGQDHFPGQEGLLNLGQQQGWKWSVFQVDGSYRPFTYFPQGDVPFLYDK